MVKISPARLLLGCLLWLSVGFFAVAPSQAQQIGRENWAAAETIAGETTPAAWPVVASDIWGRVHVVWTQETAAGSGNYALVHRMKTSKGWSEPRDIILRDSWANSHPSLLITADTAYLVWAERGGLYFSSAPAWQMADTAAWSPKEPLVLASGITQSRLAVDGQGVLHLVYGGLGSGLGGDGYVTYLRSEDGGKQWTDPLKISDAVDAAEMINTRPRLAIDKTGGVHVTWSLHKAPAWRGEAVFYTHLLADNDQWSPPRKLSQPKPADAEIWWQAAPSIVVDSAGGVHLVWVCGDHPQRCYRYSADFGRTWSQTTTIFNNLESLAGWDDMVIDDQDTIHFVAQLRTPHSVYHAQKPFGQTWQQPLPATQDKNIVRRAHYPRIALARGNQVYIVTQPDQPGPVWFLNGTMPLPEQTVAPTPVGGVLQPPPPIVTPRIVIAPLENTMPSGLAAAGIPTAQPNQQPSWVYFSLALLPVGALVMGRVLWQSWRRKRQI